MNHAFFNIYFQFTFQYLLSILIFVKERQVQLAYVTTEAKPPREVRRKQVKFGTGSGVHLSVPVAAPSRSVPQAHHRNFGSSPVKKQAGLCI